MAEGLSVTTQLLRTVRTKLREPSPCHLCGTLRPPQEAAPNFFIPGSCPNHAQWGDVLPRLTADDTTWALCVRLAERLVTAIAPHGTILPATATVHLTAESSSPIRSTEPPMVGVKLWATTTPPKDGQQPVSALLERLRVQCLTVSASVTDTPRSRR